MAVFQQLLSVYLGHICLHWTNNLVSCVYWQKVAGLTKVSAEPGKLSDLFVDISFFHHMYTDMLIR